MSTINILIAVDEENLIQQINGFDSHGNPKVVGSEASPINLGSWSTSDQFIFMIAKANYVINQQAKSELKISAHSGDTVIWRMVTLSLGDSYDAILYDYVFNPTGYMNKPQMFESTLTGYQPKDVNKPAGELISVDIPDCKVSSNVSKPHQEIQYYLKFRLVDRDGNTIGWYTWDPFISIK